MADNVTAEAVVSAGLIFATDDIGGTHFPKTKIVIGADDAQTPLLGGTGVDAAGVIRMSLATDIGLPTGTNSIGQVTANAGTNLNTSLLALESGGNLATLAGTVSGSEQQVDIVGPLPAGTNNIGDIGQPGFISTNNTTTTPLGISAVFTGTGEDVTVWSSISIIISTDESSATGGFSIQFSDDNTNWDHIIARDVTANIPENIIVPVVSQFFRVVYTNGTTAQTFFRLQTLFRPVASTIQAEHLSTTLVEEDLAANVRAVLAAKTPAGPFVNIGATNGGNLKIGIEEANGDIQGGGTEATALRVTMATDSTGLLSVDDNGGSLTVDNATLDTAGGGTEAAAQRVTIANDSTGLLSVDDNGGSLTVDNVTLDTVGGGTEAAAQRVTIANDSTGVLSVDDNGGSLTVDNGGTFATQATLQTGANLAGDFGLSGARTSGGTTFHKNIDVDETEDAVKATAGQVYWIHAINSTAAPIFLKFYNATVATVVVGTTVPDLTFPVPANADSDGAGFTLSIPNGIAFGTAITIAATLLVADNDATSPGGANALVVNLGFA